MFLEQESFEEVKIREGNVISLGFIVFPSNIADILSVALEIIVEKVCYY